MENLPPINMMLGGYPDELIQIVRGVNRDNNPGICLDVAHTCEHGKDAGWITGEELWVVKKTLRILKGEEVKR